MKNKLMEIGLSPLASVQLRGHNIMTRSYIVNFNDKKGNQSLLQIDPSNLVAYDSSKLSAKVEVSRNSSHD